MSKEKQIEEMREELIVIQQEFNEYCAKPCRVCDLGGIVCCEKHYQAEQLYNAGYRKQSEGHWIVTDADSGSFGEYEPFIEFKCSKCESTFGIESGQYDWQYGDPIPWVACPLCGAKMKGGAE